MRIILTAEPSFISSCLLMVVGFVAVVDDNVELPEYDFLGVMLLDLGVG